MAPFIKKDSFFITSIVPVLLLVTVGFICYSNTFSSPFALDDNHTIVQNPFIKINTISIAEINKVISHSHNRWAPDLSFAFNYYLGGLTVWGYHLVNLLIHILTGMALYFLGLATLRLPLLANRFSHHREIALATAIVWLAHPIQTNAVTYIVQRMTSMAALFYLYALLFYVYGRFEKRRAIKRYGYFAACLVSGLMAITSKQNAAMLPIMILAYEIFFIREVDWQKDWRRIVVSLSGSIVFVFSIGWLLTGGKVISMILSGYAGWNFTLVERLLTEPRVIFHYLSLLVLPLPSRLRLDYDFALSTGLFVPPQTFLAIIALCGLVYLGIYLFQKDRLVSFGIFWFLGNLVIESSIIPLDLVFEHRLYLPSTFVFLAAVATCFRLGTARIVIVRGSLLVVCVCLALFTLQRNAIWATPYTLWSDVVAKSPNLSRGYVNLAITVKEKGQIQEAEDLLLKAVEVNPDNGVAYYNLAQVYDIQGRFKDALVTLQKALKTPNVNITVVHSFMAEVYLELGDYSKAIQEANITLKRNTRFLQSYIVLGRAYEKLGEYEKALKQFEKASMEGLNSAYLYESWADTYLSKGHVNKAILYYTRALNLNSIEGKVYINLASLYVQKKRFKDAFAVLDKALIKSNADPVDIYIRKGELYNHLGDYQKAIKEFMQTLNVNPNLLFVHVSLGRVYENNGEHDKAIEQYETASNKGLDTVYLHLNWATAYLSKNMPEKALPFLKRVVALEPGNTEGHFTLSNTFKRLGRDEDAAREMEIYNQLK